MTDGWGDCTPEEAVEAVKAARRSAEAAEGVERAAGRHKFYVIAIIAPDSAAVPALYGPWDNRPTAEAFAEHNVAHVTKSGEPVSRWVVESRWEPRP